MFLFTIATSLLLLLQSAGGSIDGYVFATTSGKPVVFAKIIATRLATKTAGQAPTAVTDQNGHFVFRSIEPGTYFLRAAADGYSQEDAGNGRDSSLGATTQVVLSSGQVLKGINFHLAPAGRISGKVSGDGGGGLPHVQVSVVRSTFTAEGNRLASQFVSGETDDSGQYQIGAIPPGHYYLLAEPSNRPGSEVPLVVAGSGRNYPKTFYPASRVLTGANLIEVRPDANIGNLDFQLMQEPTHHIRGRVVDAEGRALGGRIAMTLTSLDGLVSTRSVNVTSFFSDGNGGFDFDGLLSGSYLLRAISPSAPALQALTASSMTDVRDSDVDDILIRFKPYVSVSGRIRVEGQGPDVDISRLSLFVHARDPWVSNLPATAIKHPAGTFEVSGLTMGEYEIDVRGIPPSGRPDGLYLKAMKFGSQDILRDPLTITGPANDRIEVILGKNGGRIRVTVQDSGRFAPGASVLLVPDRRDHYYLYKYNTTGPTGACVFNGVAPGSYKIFAFGHIEMNSWFDSETLRPYERFGSPIKIIESSTVPADLKLIGS